jgi:hypothetical protein
MHRRTKILLRLSGLVMAANLFALAASPLSAAPLDGGEVPSGGCQQYGEAIEPFLFLCRCFLTPQLLECAGSDPTPNPTCAATQPQFCSL